METAGQNNLQQQVFSLLWQARELRGNIQRRAADAERTYPVQEFELQKQVGELLLPHVAEGTLPPIDNLGRLAKSLGGILVNRAGSLALGVAEKSLVHYHKQLDGQIDELLKGATITSRLAVDAKPGNVYCYREGNNGGLRSGLYIETPVISGSYHSVDSEQSRLRVKDAEIDDKVWEIRMFHGGEQSVELDISY